MLNSRERRRRVEESGTKEVKEVNGWRMRWEVSNVPCAVDSRSLTDQSGIMGI